MELFGFSLPVFIISLVLGTCLVGLGTLLGRWSTRKIVPFSGSSDSTRMLRILTQLCDWTESLAGHVSEYQGEVDAFAERCGQPEADGVADPETLLGRILSANKRMRRRVETAEAALQRQK